MQNYLELKEKFLENVTHNDNDVKILNCFCEFLNSCLQLMEENEIESEQQ